MPDASPAARSLTSLRCAAGCASIGLVAAFIPALSDCRPGKSRDPYAVPDRLGTRVRTFRNKCGRWLWVPAFAGTTAELYGSRTALRQVVVGVERLRVLLGLGVEPAIFDHQVDGISHVLVGDLERPLSLG